MITSSGIFTGSSEPGPAIYPEIIQASKFSAVSLVTPEYKYRPIIKDKGFCPNPVVKYGVPDYADSAAHPEVKTTLAFKEYWEEQFEYCVNGYTTGGLFIPGRYYYYLNFNMISTVGRGYHYPDFVDSDYEYFTLYDYAKANGKGIIVIKARRRGMSEKYAKGILGYGVRFRSEKYKAGIVSGLQTYSDGLFNKFKEINSYIRPELFVNNIKTTDEKWIAGREIKNSLGRFVKTGSFNEIICKTAGTNENVLKSNYFDDLAMEEAGEFPLLIPTFGATKDSMMDGDIMVGTPMIFGTGGNIQSQSKGFAEMYYDNEAYNLLRFECFGPRLYKKHFIGSTNRHDEVDENCPGIYHHPELQEVAPEQILGCEDTITATQTILNNRAKYAKLRNKKKYYDELQNNPLNAKEAFLKFGACPFDTQILAENADRIASYMTPRYEKYLLKWVREKDGKVKIPLEVTAELAPMDEPEENCVLVQHLPVKGFRNLDVAGLDSYDVDEATSSRSLGAMVIVRTKNLVTNQKARDIAAVIRQRPSRKEKFYENTLMAAVWYGLTRNVMIDFAKPMIMEYWKRNGGKSFLARRPKSFESDKSEQTHEFGVLITIRNRDNFISLLQGWVLDYSQDNCIPLINNELQAYDTDMKESDCDAADALGYALMRIADMKSEAVDFRDEIEDPFKSEDIAYDEEGNAVRLTSGVSLSGIHYTKYTDPIMQQLVKEGKW